MSNSIKHKFRQNIFIISIIITIIFLVINISLYVINNNYLIDKVEEENNAFLQITTHIINENELPVVLEYVEHYTHIHEVNIEILNEDDEMVFSSNVSQRYTTRYNIETQKGIFTIFMDNTDSITVNRIERNTIYVNIALIAIYVISLVVVVRVNKQNSSQINSDIKSIMKLMNHEEKLTKNFYFTEFEEIYNSVTRYLENIDRLTEQKEMNMKGLAHDIKTPLTLVYSYFERVQRNDVLTDEERLAAFDASRRINELLNDLLENKAHSSYQNIHLSDILQKTLKRHDVIFANKNIQIEDIIQQDVYIKWNQKDLQRVLDNIISNAYYYSKEDSVFSVKLTKNRTTTLTFTSTPEHIENIQIESVFAKGYRGISSDLVNSYGKGYGLYLCRLLLESIGGTIEASKKEQNVEFTIHL